MSETHFDAWAAEVQKRENKARAADRDALEAAEKERARKRKGKGDGKQKGDDE